MLARKKSIRNSKYPGLSLAVFDLSAMQLLSVHEVGDDSDVLA
jgi:hypothetical protein